MKRNARCVISLLLCAFLLCSCGKSKLEGRYELEKLEIDGTGIAPMGTDDSYLEINSGLSTIYLSLGDYYSILTGYIGDYRDSASYQVFNFRVTSCYGDLLTNVEGSTIFLYYYPEEDKVRIDSEAAVFWYRKAK